MVAMMTVVVVAVAWVPAVKMTRALLSVVR